MNCQATCGSFGGPHEHDSIPDPPVRDCPAAPVLGHFTGLDHSFPALICALAVHPFEGENDSQTHRLGISIPELVVHDTVLAGLTMSCKDAHVDPVLHAIVENMP